MVLVSANFKCNLMLYAFMFISFEGIHYEPKIALTRAMTETEYGNPPMMNASQQYPAKCWTWDDASASAVSSHWAL